MVTVTVEKNDLENQTDTPVENLPEGFDPTQTSLDFYVPVSVKHYPVIEGGPIKGWEVTSDFSDSAYVSYSVMMYKKVDPFSGETSVQDDMPVNYKGTLNFSLKRKNITTGENELIAQSNCIIRNSGNGPVISVLQEDGSETTFFQRSHDFILDASDLNEGDILYAVFSSDMYDLTGYINYSDPVIASSQAGTEPVSLSSVLYKTMDDSEEALLFGGGFRNWYFGRWNGEKTTDGEYKLDPELMVIHRSELEHGNELSEDRINEIIDQGDGFTDIASEFPIIERLKSFSPLVADPHYYWENDGAHTDIKKWQKLSPAQVTAASSENMPVYTGNDSDTWVGPSTMSATRVILKNLDSLTG